MSESERRLYGDQRQIALAKTSFLYYLHDLLINYSADDPRLVFLNKFNRWLPIPGGDPISFSNSFFTDIWNKYHSNYMIHISHNVEVWYAGSLERRIALARRNLPFIHPNNYGVCEWVLSSQLRFNRSRGSGQVAIDKIDGGWWNQQEKTYSALDSLHIGKLWE